MNTQAAYTSTRRTFLKHSLGAVGTLLLGPSPGAALASRRGKIPIAGVATVYRRNSHAHVILGKILEGFNQEGGLGPNLELVSLYMDQFPAEDRSRDLAKKFGFRLCETIDEAINLGGNRVGVEGVLSIGEHGEYPSDPVTKQQMYPRKRFFDESIAAMQRGGRMVPFFNDKHLSHSTEETVAMYQKVRELKLPFMAGSSLPVAWRVPSINVPLGSEMEGAMALGYGGVESYGFHALETLQCMVERRKGGETGVRSVRSVRGQAIFEAEKNGYWNMELLTAALGRAPGELDKKVLLDGNRPFFLIDYRDGFKASVCMVPVKPAFSFACKLKGDDRARGSEFRLQIGAPYYHFAYLVKAIEHMVATGVPAYPAERTVLTSVVLNAAMRSLAQDGASIATPELDLAYQPTDWAPAPGLPPRPRDW